MRARTTAVALLAGLTLAGCSSNSDDGSSEAKSTSHTQDASTDYATLHAAVPTSKLTVVVTAANDGNHLLGRPHEYTSAIKFSDSRIKASDVDGLDKDDVTRGGGIEVFTSHDDAQTRANYIQTVTKGMPALSEYDYVSGDAVIRVSHLLTPAQAAGYKTAAKKLG